MQTINQVTAPEWATAIQTLQDINLQVSETNQLTSALRDEQRQAFKEMKEINRQNREEHLLEHRNLVDAIQKEIDGIKELRQFVREKEEKFFRDLAAEREEDRKRAAEREEEEKKRAAKREEEARRRAEEFDRRLAADREEEKRKAAEREEEEKKRAAEREEEEKKRAAKREEEARRRAEEFDRRLAADREEDRKRAAKREEEARRRAEEFDRRLAADREEEKRKAAEREEEEKKRAEKHERYMEEMRKLSMETRQAIRELSTRFGSTVGNIIEGLMSSSATDMFTKAGYDMHSKHKNMRRKTTDPNDGMEVDVFLYNDTSSIAIEVKASCDKKDIDRFLLQMKKFRKLFPQYADLEVMGAIAAVNYENDADDYAHECGLIVVRTDSDNFFAIDPCDKSKLRRF